MPLFFLVPLSAGLITGYICKESSDEIAQLSGVATVISLIVSLILAPWEIQLLLLILIIFTTHKLLLKNEYKLKLQDYNQKEFHYNSNSQKTIYLRENNPVKINQQYSADRDEDRIIASKIVEEEITGKYRGIPWKIHRLIKLKTPDA
ncbi:MAG: DUF4278 domain-containing protein [Nostocaceae cyanobacterium]|nr:DUF4278 domain-containing protein [Nostocaceae cyanobacterium]